MKISVSGIRGVYGKELGLNEVRKFSRLFASSIIKIGGNCVLANDTRPSSRVISPVVLTTLMEQGINVYNLGMAPTPIVFKEARKYGGGIVLTASHNPPEWNGLKFILNGRGIYENELDVMLKSTPTQSDKVGKEYDIVSDYSIELIDFMKYMENKCTRLAFDLGGGATCGYTEHLFNELRTEFYCINHVAGRFSRNLDPTVDKLIELRKLVVTKQLDFGFAFDTDGDRVVVVDRKGDKLNPDITILFCIAGALKMGMKKFVTSIDTSVSVSKLINLYHGDLHFSKVGEANVVKRMLELEAEAGGEGGSGGFIMPKFNICRDGLLASVIISSLDRNMLEECFKLKSEYHLIRTKIPINSDIYMELIDRLTDTFKSQSSEILTVDGVKVILDDDSWILIRPSNTEHVIRITVESKINHIQPLYKKVMNKIKSMYDPNRH